MAAAGFPYSLVIDGVESNWKQCRFGDANPGVDSTSRLLPDGTTNEGFADRDYDISTFTFTVTEPAQKADDVRGDASEQLFAGVAAGYRNESDAWYITYDGVTLYAGTGIYCSGVDGNGSIPGEGMLSASFQAIGVYAKG